MNKVVIAITVLSVGLIAWFLCGSQASAFAQSSPALERSLLIRPDAIPEIPEINSHFSRTHAAGGRQQLDGMDISNSEFKDKTWEYSGGAVSLNDVTISTPMRVHFSGAAANTLAMLYMQQISAIDRSGEPISTLPAFKITKGPNNTMTVNFESPYK